nr:retrotransposon protein, putative, Ty3-gypsy subclass [Tanacetum cinerariifolium]
MKIAQSASWDLGVGKCGKCECNREGLCMAEANVLADALSRKSGMLANLQIEPEIIRDLERMDIELCIHGTKGYWAGLNIEPNLILRIKEAQKVKIEHQRANRLLQPLDIPVWKWDEISIDFVMGLPRTQKKNDAIWVVIDRLTKSAHFLPVQDMLRSCALEWTGNWDEYLCLVEFAYNNGWHASIMAAPYELLYGRKCRAPICWNEVGEQVIEGPELIKVTNEKVTIARKSLKKLVSYPLDQIHENLSLVKEPEKIIDRQEQVMRNKTISFVKILWKNHPEREATWETKESMRAIYLRFFS